MCVIDIWRIAGRAGEWCGKFDGLEVPNLVPKYYFSKVEEERKVQTLTSYPPKDFIGGIRPFRRCILGVCGNSRVSGAFFNLFQNGAFLKKPLLPFLITNTCQTVAVRIPSF